MFSIQKQSVKSGLRTFANKSKIVDVISVGVILYIITSYFTGLLVDIQPLYLEKELQMYIYYTTLTALFVYCMLCYSTVVFSTDSDNTMRLRSYVRYFATTSAIVFVLIILNLSLFSGIVYVGQTLGELSLSLYLSLTIFLLSLILIILSILYGIVIFNIVIYHLPKGMNIRELLKSLPELAHRETAESLANVVVSFSVANLILLFVLLVVLISDINMGNLSTTIIFGASISASASVYSCINIEFYNKIQKENNT